MSEQEPLCARCARVHRTCCQTSEVFVTLGDIARIAASGASDFYEYRVAEDPIYQQQDNDPVWQRTVVRPDGTRRVLKRRGDGCFFLGPRGCTLSSETRPLVCRLYPYHYDASGLLPYLAEGCPLQLLPPGRGLIDELGMSFTVAEGWHRQLYAEILEEAEEEKRCA